MKTFTVSTPYDGFRRIFNYVYEYHNTITTEDGAATYESDSICIKILNPLKEPSKLIDAYCMGHGAVRDYVAQFNDGISTSGFEYTYYERLKDWNGDNQLKTIVDNLRKSLDTRRAVIMSDADAALWRPQSDMKSSEPPCFNWMQALVRNNELNLKVLFRSHDILKGWPANILAIAEMQRRMASQLPVVNIGYLEVISSIPHMYVSDINLIERTRERLK